ncbi:MAG TPA: hypothetical protein P5205_06695 [Candidatus Paceibacterota bacterium]|nr:hypothetical protein [Verrucomicrobiota bacterium]HSA10044.1 hypothetical protein [Candidatus Paceibacterota bacterium]
MPEATGTTPPEEESSKCSIISAVSDEEVLNSCLLSSPDVRRAADVILQTGYPSAALAYNAALEKAKTNIVMFVHQDVYLPEGWLRTAQNAVGILSKIDPDWGVLGCWGVRPSGERAGFVYDGGWRRILGGPFEGGQEVESLDEVVLILRKSSGLRFDQQLRGFHMYGTDICLEARRRGMKCYAISAFCVHNTNGYNLLPYQFWRNCWWIRNKWKAKLPVPTPCIDITYFGWPMIKWNVIRSLNILLKRHKPARRAADPRALYEDMVRGGIVERATST